MTLSVETFQVQDIAMYTNYLFLYTLLSEMKRSCLLYSRFISLNILIYLIIRIREALQSPPNPRVYMRGIHLRYRGCGAEKLFFCGCGLILAGMQYESQQKIKWYFNMTKFSNKLLSI